MGHWIIDSLDSFKRLIHSETVFMNESLNHWLTRFIQTADSFSNCLYEWVTESLTHSIHSNGWFIQKLSLWMSHWIIDSLDSFKYVDSFRNKTPLYVTQRHTTVLLWLWLQLLSSAKLSKNSQYFVKSKSLHFILLFIEKLLYKISVTLQSCWYCYSGKHHGCLMLLT